MKALAAIAFVVLFILLAFAWVAAIAWLLMLVLGAFGVEWGFWLCAGIVALVSLACGLLRRRS